MMSIPAGAPIGLDQGPEHACRMIANGIEFNIVRLLLARCAAYLRSYYTAMLKKAKPFGDAARKTHTWITRTLAGELGFATSELANLSTKIFNVEADSMDGLLDS